MSLLPKARSRAIGRRGRLAMGGALGLSSGLGRSAGAVTRTRKFALEEHFSTADLEKKGYVGRPTHSDTVFADIERRLQDFEQLRLEAMDEAGIDMSVLSVTTPGIQGVADALTGTTVRHSCLPRSSGCAPSLRIAISASPSCTGGRARPGGSRSISPLRRRCTTS
jgi:hypothetical protein